MGSVNVLYVAGSGLTALTGGGWTRIAGEAREARKHGFFVRILCFVPPQHFVLKPKFVVTAKASLEKEAQSPVYFVPRLPLTRVRWIHWLNDWYSAMVVLLFCLLSSSRVVHCHGIMLTHWGLMAKKVCGSIKVVADVHGASVEEYMYENKLKHRNKIVKIMEKQELSALIISDWIIFVSKSMQRYYKEKYQILLKNSCIIPCATDATITIDWERRERLRQENDLNGKIVFCYIGSGETYQLPQVMCQLFAKILHQFPYSFFLIFSPHRDVFLKHLKAAGIDSCYYKVLSVEHEKIFDLLQMGDVGFLLRDSSVVNRVASPTKFAEYLLCGLPVITTGFVGDFSDMVRQYKLGWVVDLDRLEVDSGLSEFIRDVWKKRGEYANRCSSFAKQHLSWETYGDELAKVYRSLTRGIRALM